jgi:hypothetical protein
VQHDTTQSVSRLNGSVVSLLHRAPSQAAASAGALQAQERGRREEGGSRERLGGRREEGGGSREEGGGRRDQGGGNLYIYIYF